MNTEYKKIILAWTRIIIRKEHSDNCEIIF
jgi:hypothetical protein